MLETRSFLPAVLRRAAPRLAALALPLALAACSDDVADVEYEPGTPREAVVRFNEALGRLDKDEARAWVATGAEQDQLFEIQFGMAEIVTRFKRRYVEVYGEDKLVLLYNPPGAELDVLEPFADRERLEGMILEGVDETGQYAFMRFPDGNLMRVKLEDGQWRVDVVGTEPIEQVLSQLGPQMYLARLISDATEKIGTDDMTAADFDLRLGRYIENGFAQAQAAMQGVEAPSFSDPGAAPSSTPTTGHEGHAHDPNDPHAHDAD